MVNLLRCCYALREMRLLSFLEMLVPEKVLVLCWEAHNTLQKVSPTETLTQLFREVWVFFTMKMILRHSFDWVRKLWVYLHGGYEERHSHIPARMRLDAYMQVKAKISSWNSSCTFMPNIPHPFSLTPLSGILIFVFTTFPLTNLYIPIKSYHQTRFSL